MLSLAPGARHGCPADTGRAIDPLHAVGTQCGIGATDMPNLNHIRSNAANATARPRGDAKDRLAAIELRAVNRVSVLVDAGEVSLNDVDRS